MRGCRPRVFALADLCKRGRARDNGERTTQGGAIVAYSEIERLASKQIAWTDVNVGKPNAVFLKTLNHDPETGAVLLLVHEPPGFRGSGGGRPHYLPVDEEAYFLTGEMIGDPETTWFAGDYIFYPKGFLHSPDDATEIGAHIVMRLSGPMSYVNGELPSGRPWTRADERQLLPGQANSRRPISRLRTGDWPWEDLMIDAVPTGERIKVLSVERETGALTFLHRVEAGWRAPFGRRTSACQREWFVLDGAFATGGSDGVTLEEWDYRCLAPGTPFGGDGESSAAGCTMLGWSDGPLDHTDQSGKRRTVTLG